MSLLYFLIAIIASLLVARYYKSTKVYTILMLCLSLGFVVGTSVKGAVANAPTTQTQELVTAANPTHPASSAVVLTVDCPQDLGKEMQSDTVKTNSEKVTKQPTYSEIEDDS
jgi:ABC-type transport system involved in multi-copper enzyme maturation permease subunit